MAIAENRRKGGEAPRRARRAPARRPPGSVASSPRPERRVRSRRDGVPAWPGAPGLRGDPVNPAAIDGAQCLDLFWPRGDVLRRLALSTSDHDLDGECDADRVAVHPGLCGVLLARIPVCARELSDSTRSEGFGLGVLGDAERLLAILTGLRLKGRSKRRGRASDAPPFFGPFILRESLGRGDSYWVSSNRAKTVTVSLSAPASIGVGGAAASAAKARGK